MWKYLLNTRRLVAPGGLHSRSFSDSSVSSREYAHVVRRKVRFQREVQVNDPDTLLPSKQPAYPPYPYGPSLIYKQSNRGLYGGKFLQFGNKISEKFNQKSGRIFYPNVQKTMLWSEALNRRVRIKLVASVLRTITKEGGLDNYLIKDSPSRIKELGPFGWNLRYDVLQKMKELERAKPKPIENLTVGRARLIKDLFVSGGSSGETFKSFRLRHRATGADDLLQMLQSHGQDLSQYKPAQ